MRFGGLPGRGRHRIDRQMTAMFSVQAVYTRRNVWLGHLHPGVQTPQACGDLLLPQTSIGLSR